MKITPERLIYQITVWERNRQKAQDRIDEMTEKLAFLRSEEAKERIEIKK